MHDHLGSPHGNRLAGFDNDRGRPGTWVKPWIRVELLGGWREQWCDGATTLGVNAAWKPYFLLALIYVMSQLFTESITNVAVATTMIPVAVNLAIVAGYDPRPFIVAVTLAASLSFVTPIGYQTNLMVMGPGGYHPRDYWRAGWPLALLLTVTGTLIPRIFPFIR